MKTLIPFTAALLAAAPLLAADPGPKDQIAAASKQLADKANYSWKTTVAVPESAQFRPGPTEGKTEKGGYTCLTMSFGDDTTEAVLKGDGGAVKSPEGDWQTLAELEEGQGRGRFLGRMLRNTKTPAAQAAELAQAAKELRKDGEAIAGDLTDEGAKAQFRFGTVTNPKASVKFWLKEGALSKFELKVTGKVDFNGNEMDVDRTTTVEIKDVGSTKIDVPEAAKKKLS